LVHAEADVAWLDVVTWGWVGGAWALYAQLPADLHPVGLDSSLSVVVCLLVTIAVGLLC
jgi:hypothetical protein